jgi:hypothetical protein
MLREFLIFVLFSTWGIKRLIGRRGSFVTQKRFSPRD